MPDISKAAMPRSLVDLSNTKAISVWVDQFVNSGLCPDHWRGRGADLYVALQLGAEAGLTLTQSALGICVIKGVPSVYGTVGRGLVNRHPDFRGIKEVLLDEDGNDCEDSGKEPVRARCTLTRATRDGQQTSDSKSFSIDDAKRAKLWMKKGKSGRDTPWVTSWPDMLRHRAFWRIAKEVFPDALYGMSGMEEQDPDDIEEVREAKARVVEQRAEEPDAIAKLAAALDVGSDAVEKHAAATEPGAGRSPEELAGEVRGICSRLGFSETFMLAEAGKVLAGGDESGACELLSIESLGPDDIGIVHTHFVAMEEDIEARAEG